MFGVLFVYRLCALFLYVCVVVRVFYVCVVVVVCVLFLACSC